MKRLIDDKIKKIEKEPEYLDFTTKIDEFFDMISNPLIFEITNNNCEQLMTKENENKLKGIEHLIFIKIVAEFIEEK